MRINYVVYTFKHIYLIEMDCERCVYIQYKLKMRRIIEKKNRISRINTLIQTDQIIENEKAMNTYKK